MVNNVKDIKSGTADETIKNVNNDMILSGTIDVIIIL